MGDDANLYEAYQSADTSFLSEALRFSAATVAGAVISILIVLVLAWPWRHPNARRLRIAWPLALAVGFFAAASLLNGPPRSFLAEDQHRLLAAILPAVMLIEVLAAFLPLLYGWLLRIALAALVPWLVLHGSSYLVDPTGLGLSQETWKTDEALTWLSILSALLLTTWLVANASTTADDHRSESAPAASPRHAEPRPIASTSNGWIILIIAISAGVAGGTIFHFGYMTAGKLGIILSVLTGVLWLLSLFFRQATLGGLAGVAIVMFFSLLVMGRFFGSLSSTQALLLLAAPVLAGLVELPGLRSEVRWLRHLLSLLVAAVPLAFVVLTQLVPIESIIEYNTRMVLLGVTVLGTAAGLVGCFAVLRRRALTGDALAHAALPGVCVAFLIVRRREFLPLLIGAFVSGIAGVAVIAALRRWTRIKEDAAIGIVLGVFFGAGIFLLSLVQRMAGGGVSGLDAYILGKTASMTWGDVAPILALAAATLVMVLVLFKEFKVVSFDADFAQAQGWPAHTLDLLLMALIALTVVIGLPAVGVLMIAALLITPAVVARFWTEQLTTMLFLAAGTGALMGVVGTLISREFGVPASAAIILSGAVLFLLSAIAAPRRGLVARAINTYNFRTGLEERKLLRTLYELSGASKSLPAIDNESLLVARSWSPRRLRTLLRDAERSGWVQSDRQTSRLTSAGLQRAAQVARGQMLWELFLREYPDLAQSYANLSAESVETVLPEILVQDLTAKLPAPFAATGSEPA